MKEECWKVEENIGEKVFGCTLYDALLEMHTQDFMQ